ncbi:MAG: 23S rRNA (adenine(2503)-C(2))-methyltransferase RlmN [Phycisphaerae bacterium]|nr:23S rRNA (adenine(2503)-C(2))-methyltransferase RlmN [Phycisphaerae bacterium]
MIERGHNPHHALPLLRRLFQQPDSFFDGESWTAGLSLPKALIAALRENPLRSSSVVRRHESADGTVKLLIEFEDGQAVESVLMAADHPERAAACLSSQVGCAMGCGFCASTKNGLKRNLTAGEIVEQYLHLHAVAKTTNRRIANIVFMGMGEPMHNLDSVMAAIERITDRDVGSIGKRHVTVSTVGIVDGIDRLAASGLRTHLALSLHAPDDETRAKLVPMNRKYGVDEIMAAARRYQTATGRIVIIEYCLLAGINDSDEQALKLVELLDGVRMHVNLIPYNVIAGVEYRRPSRERINRFLTLVRTGAVSHLRKTRGDEVAAACGQLAVRRVTEPGPVDLQTNGEQARDSTELAEVRLNVIAG